jgi:hypothetical protein
LIDQSLHVHLQIPAELSPEVIEGEVLSHGDLQSLAIGAERHAQQRPHAGYTV